MLLGIDAGGTSTRAVVVDHLGKCHGYGVAGGGNPVSRGADQAGAAIVTAARRAVAEAARRGSDADDDVPVLGGTAVLALAGGRTDRVPGSVLDELRQLGSVGELSVASDVLGMYFSGTPLDSGYALVAGTGTAAIRVEHGRIAASIDGLGWLLGDGGSGFWIGQRTVRAALASLSGHGPVTALAGMLEQELGLDPHDRRRVDGRLAGLDLAVNTLYALPPVQLSQFAPLAFRAADDGDPVAAAIVTAARQRLIDTVAAARTDRGVGPVVLGGAVARRLPRLAEGIRAAWRDAGGDDPQITLVADGVVGAGVLALRAAGATVDQQMFERLSSSLTTVRAAAVADVED